jgi:catechol 2,3-dioxygenase-like lactoylglutathione lyase family enzyme
MNLTDVVPNLIVADIDRSAAFYRDALAFETVTTVPDQAPFVFVWLRRGGVSVFLNAAAGVREDMPALAARPIGGTATLFVTIEADTIEAGVDALFAAVAGRARVVMPLKDQFYGMREFAIEDPDGYVIIFAQRTSGA